MKLSVAVMAMREREHYVAEMLERLDAPATVVWDITRDRWNTGKAAIAAHDPDATHHLVLQDDAVVCCDLVASLHRAVEALPDNPLCLYFGYGTNGAHQRTNRLAQTNRPPCLLRFEGPWWGVGVVFPVKLIPAMLALADRPRSSRAYDKRLSGALGRMNIDTYYVLPSLADHRIDGPSMVEGREQDGRRAHHFIGEDASALDVDWSSLKVIDGHRQPTLRHRRAPRPSPASLLPRAPRPATSERIEVSAAVMAHPKRAALVPSLLEKLDAPATVVYDERGDRWDTGRRAWLACDPDATHALVVQDDAIPCAGLVAGLSKALEVVGDNPVGLYVGNVRPTTQLMGAMVAHAQATGASWVIGEGPWWGVGVAVPTHMLTDMLAWCDAHPEVAAYDRRMARYFASQGIACWYPLPSLVDHRTDVPSLIPGRNTKRTARSFIGEGVSALSVDWSKLPQHAGAPYVTYTGPASRRFHQCLHCTYYTPHLHAIRSHVASCVPEARNEGDQRLASVR